MKKLPYLLVLFGLLVGCEKKSTELEAGQDYAHITGTVYYAENLQPVYNAFIQSYNHPESTTTDSSGQYDLAIALPKDYSEYVTLEISKVGYLEQYLSLQIEAGAATQAKDVALERYLDSTITDTGYTGSGPGETIVLISMEPETLSVAGAGGQTVSEIICEVRDGNGKPVDSLHAAQILFELIEDPGGGAYIYPTTDVTDDSGWVTTSFHAGTDAGLAIIKVQFATSSNYTILPEIIIYQTGEPASIELVSLEYDSVAVKGIGANEATTAVFVVKDAGGSPISSQQPKTVNFEIQGETGGGEYLYPTSDVTDPLGQVTTTLNSGTVAGTVQLLAYLDDDNTIACSPIPIAIHSGLPHPDHFGVYPVWINFPGYNYFGRVDSITALVADMYSNPVPQGTSVYFSTDAGVIEGSATTDSAGFATVALFSGPPVPPPSNPFGMITAQTVGEGGAILTDTTQVLFSGITQIYDIDPTSFYVENGQSQVFTFRLSDQNGYPLAHDTRIEVESTAGSVIGDVDVTFPDTQSQAWTYFSFVLFDTDTEEEDPAVIAAVSINVTSQNGDASIIIGGYID